MPMQHRRPAQMSSTEPAFADTAPDRTVAVRQRTYRRRMSATRAATAAGLLASAPGCD